MFDIGMGKTAPCFVNASCLAYFQEHEIMNIPRLIAAVFVAFVTVWVTDFLIHGVWLAPVYAATMELWRPEAEMIQKMPWMFLGQFLAAATFTLIFAAHIAPIRCWKATIVYSLCMGIFSQSMSVIMYAVQPYPGHVVAKWFFAGLIQAVILGLVANLVYKPKPTAA
jgi:hypothetical protein